MAYFVTLTFDLHHASWEDYETAHAELAKIGLDRVIVSTKGLAVEITESTCAGEFTGTSAAEVRDHVLSLSQRAFERNGLKGKIFAAVGSGWAWGQRNPDPVRRRIASLLASVPSR